MHPERTAEFRPISEAKKQLLDLEKTGRYVFHGSPDYIEALEPRQAYNSNPQTGEDEKDGEPAVFATQYADIAIFRALLSGKDVPEDSQTNFGTDGGKLHFSTTRNLLEAARDKKANIYVLDKSKFVEPEGTQCRSYVAVSPIQTIEVSAKDLPENIVLLN